MTTIENVQSNRSKGSHPNRPFNRRIYNPKSQQIGVAEETQTPLSEVPLLPTAPVDAVKSETMPEKEEAHRAYITPGTRAVGKVGRGLTYDHVGSEAADRYGEETETQYGEAIVSLVAVWGLAYFVYHAVELSGAPWMTRSVDFFVILALMCLTLLVIAFAPRTVVKRSRMSVWKDHMESAHIHPYIGGLALVHARDNSVKGLQVATKFIHEKVELALSKKSGEKGAIPIYFRRDKLGAKWECDWTETSLISEISLALSITTSCNPLLLAHDDIATKHSEEWSVVHAVLSGTIGGKKVK